MVRMARLQISGEVSSLRSRTLIPAARRFMQKLTMSLLSLMNAAMICGSFGASSRRPDCRIIRL
ncbi:hypothetical protein RRF57_012127 [Xylaria bambusicola]|uniref:Uncharacterized protein n=1 Tax=Xylaria bambusicola TaxID=326684 RepID=A0AAN7UP21_9PEZI